MSLRTRLLLTKAGAAAVAAGALVLVATGPGWALGARPAVNTPPGGGGGGAGCTTGGYDRAWSIPGACLQYTGSIVYNEVAGWGYRIQGRITDTAADGEKAQLQFHAYLVEHAPFGPATMLDNAWATPAGDARTFDSVIYLDGDEFYFEVRLCGTNCTAWSPTGAQGYPVPICLPNCGGPSQGPGDPADVWSRPTAIVSS